MFQRINITLSKATVELLNSKVPKGDRSGFIDEALRFRLSEAGRAELRKRLKEGYIANAQRDLGIAQEWSSLGDDVWPKE